MNEIKSQGLSRNEYSVFCRNVKSISHAQLQDLGFYESRPRFGLYQLTEVSHSRMSELQSNASYGRPSLFSVCNGTIFLHPIPDEDKRYRLMVEGFFR